MKPRKRCERCGSGSCLSRHHLIPKRHGTDGRIMWLCRTPCHDKIEEIISKEETRTGVRRRLRDEEYVNIARSFVAA